ncbi:MAG TPA: hypothetical protein VF861_00220 [Telluria sp.]
MFRLPASTLALFLMGLPAALTPALAQAPTRGGMMGPGMMGPGMMHGGMMHGGMMHGGMMPGTPAPSATPLPDTNSAGAQLVSTYCVQCHAAPDPTLHSAGQWPDVTRRMHSHMQSAWPEVQTPTEQEMKTIVAYLQKHARL